MVLLLVATLLAASALALWYFTRNSRRLWKLTARIGAGVLICASALPVVGFLFHGAMCGQYKFPPISSSDGKRVAQVSEVDCGAVDHFHSSVQLSLDRQDFFTHIFGKRLRSATVFTVGHDPRLIGLAWKDTRTLVIRFPSDSRYSEEYRCKSEWDGVRIECIEYEPDYTKPVAEMPPVHRWLWLDVSVVRSNIAMSLIDVSFSAEVSL